MKQRLSLLLALVLFCSWLSPAAQAQSKAQQQNWQSPKHRFQIEMSGQFTKGSKNSPRLASANRPDGLRFSLSRIDYPNIRARSRKTRSAFFSEIIEGLQKSNDGFRLQSSKSSKNKGVPILDIHFSRQHKGVRERVWMRYLLHRKFSIVAVSASPWRAKSNTQKAAKRFTASLLPLLSK